MYISVIPLGHSLSKRPYTYFVSEVWRKHMGSGFLVEIPIGNHIVLGIVCGIMTERPDDIAEKDIKAIIRIVASVEIVSKATIGVILSLADTYFLLIHKVASMFLPAPLLTRLDKKNYILTPGDSVPSGNKALSIHHYIDSIFSGSDIDRYLLPGTICIFPDDILLSYFAGCIEKESQHTLGVFPSDQTPTRRAQWWIDMYEKKYDIIFWTRRILYYNLRAYTHLVYIEDAFGTEQYQYPIKIQNLDVLEALEKSQSLDITIVSSSPTLRMLSLFQKGKITAIH